MILFKTIRSKFIIVVLLFSLNSSANTFIANSKSCPLFSNSNISLVSKEHINNVVEKNYSTPPEIQVFSNSIAIPYGDTTPNIIDNTDYGSAEIGTTMTRTFTIKNSGNSVLNISRITLSNTTDFSIVGSYSSSIPISGSIVFMVKYNSLNAGIKNTIVYINQDDENQNPFYFTINAQAITSFFDSDGDGVLDNHDIDDDNDGIEDSIEELACNNSSISIHTNYKFLNENFGTGNREQINTTYDASTSYCYEDGTASCSALGGIDLNDGEYTVYHRASNGDGINDTPIGELGSWADAYWYSGEDHTSVDNNGRMAMFNAAIDPGVFYTANITGALPNIPINYSFWVLNLDRNDAPNIATRLRPNIRVEFRDVNDNILASITTGNIPPSINGDAASSWHNFSAALTFPVSEFKVYFYNNQLGGIGNDLAIDDINIVQKLCDTDNDGVANVFDLDSDNDGIPDVVESGFDIESNGKAKIDTWQDANENGMHDIFEGQSILDSDSDGTPNFIDLDSDNDSIFDVDESGAGNTNNPNFQNGDGDIDGDGVGDGEDTDAVREKDVNSDGTIEYFADGILDLYDYFNGNTFAAAYGNDSQGIGLASYVLDTDEDGLPDYIDTYDNTTSTYHISHSLYHNLDANNDGIIDDINDADGDGIVDLFDTNDTAFGSPRDLDRKLQLYFDGRNDFIQDTSITSEWSEISLMGWIKTDPNSSGYRIPFGQENFYFVLLPNGKIQIRASGTTINYDTTLPTNQWVHIGATYSNTDAKLKLFINGEPIKEIIKSGFLNADSSSFTIGRRASSNNDFFKGHIDEIRLFDKALSEDEFHKIVYQEIIDNVYVRGTEIPSNVSTLLWSNLKRYFRLDNYKHDITDDLSTPNVDTEFGAKLYNIKTIMSQSAPMPFITQQSNTSLPESLTSIEDGINGYDAVTYDWSIVKIQHDNITYNNNQSHLGLFIHEKETNSNPIEYHITNDSELNISWYLKLDGFIDLEGESQLIQGEGSMLDPNSKGKIELDQQGTADLYTYNYWSSPVSTIIEGSNNTDYTIEDILRDGTNPSIPQPINWISTGFDGTNTNPIGIADYWIWKFDNYTDEDYTLWQHVRSNGTLSVGEGFTMKGPGTGSIQDQQNYVFTGKPNNGNINLELTAGNNYLLGNPYPSAIDARQFLIDNSTSLGYDSNQNDSESPSDITPTISGTLYFWQHWGGNSHILSEYQGGYAIYNFSGAVAAASLGTNNPNISTDGTATKLPGRYIPIGQGFFVVGKNTGALKFNNKQRAFQKEGNSNSVFMRNDYSSESQSQYDSEEDDLRMKIRIGFNSTNTIHRQLLLTIDSLATPSIDYGFDAILFDDQIDDMYWMLEGGKYTVQGTDNINENTIIPLGLHVANDGINEITIDALENVPENINIYLHDKDAELYHDLKASNYNIQLEAGEYLNRFEITFGIPDILSSEEEILKTLKFYYSFSRHKIIILNPSNLELNKLEVHNIIGQNVYSINDLHQVSYSEYEIQSLSTGTYIVKLTTPMGILTKKIMVN